MPILNPKPLPFSKERIEALIAAGYPTPFYVYDEAGIRRSARALIDAFSWNRGFKEFFAVKALPNPYILNILREDGCGADCSSLPELLLAERAGIIGENIMLTSNDTPADEFVYAKGLGAIINLDDISHLPFLEQCAGLPPLLSFRYNPGNLRTGNAIIGTPAEAKYGLTRPQIFDAYRLAKAKGVKRFGLHTMIASNELNPEYFVETSRMVFDLITALKGGLGISFEFVNLGGGIGIPYRPEQSPVDLRAIGIGIRGWYKDFRLAPLKIYLECGRCITGPHGYLVSTVRHLKHTYRDYVGLDACMANLMRPALYDAYHHITVLGKEHAEPVRKYDVTGSLCENNDKFAKERMLPEVAVGDIVVIHDAGAHGHAMGFNYNGKLRSAEFLMHPDGSFRMIRRAETIEDHFATLEGLS